MGRTIDGGEGGDTMRVIFRVWKRKHGGGVFAILPDEPANPGHAVMYEHVGQHAEGTKGVLGISRLARREEYLPLLRELHSIGYRGLKVCRRWVKG